MSRISKLACSLSFVLCGLQLSASAVGADEHGRPEARGAGPGRPVAAGPNRADGRGQVYDSRYNHGRYYPAFGSIRPGLPSGYRPYYRGGSRYFFSEGVWYAPGAAGFVVVRPPAGLVISVLPPYYSTVWFGGVPYYYADNVYYSYQADQNGYAVVDPPPNADSPSAPPDGSPDTSQSNDLMIYPKNGQTREQQSADQFECYSWSKGQTGFDPTQPGGGAQGGDAGRNNYNRAMSACLTARGYQVN